MPCYTANVESSWNVMAHGDAREGKWMGNSRMEWVTSTLHTTSEHGVPSMTTADAHTSAASSRLNWRPRRFKWTRPFRRKTKFVFCACGITFQRQSTTLASKRGHFEGYWITFFFSLRRRHRASPRHWHLFPSYMTSHPWRPIFTFIEFNSTATQYCSSGHFVYNR